jgi:polysaccharide deacetylase 2 family uncharacterized protein YibQ
MGSSPVPAKSMLWRDLAVAALVALPIGAAVAASWAGVAIPAPQEPAPEIRVTVPTRAPAADAPAVVPPPVVAASPVRPQPQDPVPTAPVVAYFGIRRDLPPMADAAVAPASARPLPRVSDAGWEARAVRPPAVRTGAYVAIVIDDLGLDRARSARAAALPGPLTLAWLSYADEVGRQAAAARQAGHEILLHMPMEPEGRDDPGPGALFVRLPDADIRARVASALDQLPMAVGLNNHMGSRFTRDARAMRPVLEEIAARGLLFVDSRTSGGSIGAELATELGIAAAGRDVFLDNERDALSVRRQLAELERVAGRRGSAVAIGHPHDATLDALAAWIPGMLERGLQLVPVSAIARQRRREAPDPLVARIRAAEPPVREIRAEVSAPPPPVAAPVVQAAAEAPAADGEAPWKRFPAR